MNPTNWSRERSGALSWAASWDADRRQDRQGVVLALGAALAIHGALLLVRLAGETVALPVVDAVVHPRLETLSVKRPEPPPPPSTVPEAATPEALRVPVPAKVAPPEPLPRAEIAVVAIPGPRSQAPPSLIAFPESPPLVPEMPVRFHAKMERPVRLAGSDPAYTEIARRAREEGVVILDAVIDKAGAVTAIEVVKRLRFGLTESAVRAVETWRFEPAKLDGRPIAVRYTLTVRFALR